MNGYKAEFIEFLVEANALQFGEFTLKSGRLSPYFFNSSLFDDGPSLERLGHFYAEAARDLDPACRLIFGPAYKGIPLAVAAAMALSKLCNEPAGYFFNRKEAKTHGDKGILVGRSPVETDHVIMVDDVITDGLTKRESIKMLQQLVPAKYTGVIIAVDRMESNSEGKDSREEFEKDTGVPVRAVVTIDEICEHLLGREINGKVVMTEENHAKIQAYLGKFKVR